MRIDPIVKNAGSCARDHLANERTFLAWARTGLGYVGAGTGIFSAYHIVDRGKDPESHAARILPACACFVANGTGLVAFSVWRYFTNERAIEKGEFVICKRSLVGVVAGTSLMTLTALSILYEEEVGRQRRERRG